MTEQKSVQFSRSVVSDSATPWTAAYQANNDIKMGKKNARKKVRIKGLTLLFKGLLKINFKKDNKKYRKMAK